ncbi:MAG: hypothetical protein JWM46_886 [Candidatus Kaiserbacteria bacterium]|nr:hypothetical protein [Candidatus Kaiserbacteria bacterium]
MKQDILNKELVARAFECARPMIHDLLRRLPVKNKGLVVVVAAADLHETPRDATAFKENCLLIERFGDPTMYTGPFEAVALSKTHLSAMTGKGTAQLDASMLRVGDTVNAGSVVIGRVAAGASGSKGYFDESISYILAGLIHGFCRHEFARLKDNDAVNFVGEF